MDINEELKKVLFAGIGAVACTAEASKELIDTFVKKGEITVEQGKVMNEELKRNMKEKMKDHVTINVVNETADFLSQIENLTVEQIKALKAKLDTMTETADSEDANEETKEETSDNMEQEDISNKEEQ